MPKKKQVPTNELLLHYRTQGYASIAGLDEAGKGAWAGPVVSAAVILEDDYELDGLNDSKKVAEKKREKLFEIIKKDAIAIGVGIVESQMIDDIGLSEAHRLSMQQAIQTLGCEIDLVLADGKGISKLGIETECIVKGDSKVTSIAAASIIAKVTRDRIMRDFSERYEQYAFDSHKGYGTKKHQEAITQHGVVSIHRLSFEPVFRAWQGDLFS